MNELLRGLKMESRCNSLFSVPLEVAKVIAVISNPLTHTQSTQCPGGPPPKLSNIECLIVCKLHIWLAKCRISAILALTLMKLEAFRAITF